MLGCVEDNDETGRMRKGSTYLHLNHITPIIIVELLWLFLCAPQVCLCLGQDKETRKVDDVGV